MPPVGAAIHRATTDGIEDLGFLVRELLAEEEDQREPWGGYAWCETPIPLRDSVRARGTSGLGRRWYHVYGLRLARRPG